MSGRIIQDEKREKWINEHINNGSSYLQAYMTSTEDAKSSSTRKAYLGYLLQYEKYMKDNNIDILQVKPMHIDLYRKFIRGDGENKNGVSIVNAKLSAVISYYDFLIENQLVFENPCRNKKLPVKRNEDVVYLNQKEEIDIKTRIKARSGRGAKWSNRDCCIVTLGLATGLRVSEITNIDVDDIDFENCQINNIYVKGGYKRTVFIGANTIKSIKKWMADREKILGESNEHALFISQKRNRISNKQVETMIKKETKHMEKHITPHKLRSTCAMKLYNKTGDIYRTAQQLGHKNIKNTMIYAQTTKDKMRESATLLD